MTDKEQYREICNCEKTIPIFSQDWWLDSVCGDSNWDIFLVRNGTDIVATLPYSIMINDDGKCIERIKLTQNNGLWISYPKKQGIIARQCYEEKIINKVCDFLENLNLYSYDQQYHYHFSNYLPFFWRYYQETTKYTYVIENTADMNEVRKAYSSKLRNEIRKAHRKLIVDQIYDLEEFYKINSMSFERQGIAIPYTFEFFSKLYLACKKHNSCELLCAKDEYERIHSVAMLVWDDMSVYYLLNGTDPNLKSSQANAFLIDASIEKAHELGLMFDFEGSVIKNVNHAFREFGGIPMPYFRIKKIF